MSGPNRARCKGFSRRTLSCLKILPGEANPHQQESAVGFAQPLKGRRSRTLKKLAVFIVAHLPAALQLALNQQYLFIPRQA